jgi:hypothetical protein
MSEYQEKIKRLQKAVLKLMHWSGSSIDDLIDRGLLKEGDLK